SPLNLTSRIGNSPEPPNGTAGRRLCKLSRNASLEATGGARRTILCGNSTNKWWGNRLWGAAGGRGARRPAARRSTRWWRAPGWRCGRQKPESFHHQLGTRSQKFHRQRGICLGLTCASASCLSRFCLRKKDFSLRLVEDGGVFGTKEFAMWLHHFAQRTHPAQMRLEGGDLLCLS